MNQQSGFVNNRKGQEDTVRREKEEYHLCVYVAVIVKLHVVV